MSVEANLEDSVRRNHIDPRTVPYYNYVSIVVGTNDAMRQRLRHFLEEIEVSELVRENMRQAGIDPAGVEFGMFNIGSDGRCEKGPTSPHDIMMVAGHNPSKQSGDLHAALQGTFRSLFVRQNEIVFETNGQRYAPGAHRVFSDFEAKSLPNDVLSLYKQQPGAYWPSRMLDADPIDAEAKNIQPAMKEALAREIVLRDNGALGATLLRRERDRLKDHASITATGKNVRGGNTITHFDLNEGKAYYQLSEDIDGVSRLSFKMGPLRLIQTAIVHRIISMFRTPGFSEYAAAELLNDMETQTTRRLPYLHAVGASSVQPAILADLIDNYKYFLWLFHQSEYAYYRRQETEVPFDVPQVKQRLADTVRCISEFVNEGRKKADMIKLTGE